MLRLLLLFTADEGEETGDQGPQSLSLFRLLIRGSTARQADRVTQDGGADQDLHLLLVVLTLEQVVRCIDGYLFLQWLIHVSDLGQDFRSGGCLCVAVLDFDGASIGTASFAPNGLRAQDPVLIFQDLSLGHLLTTGGAGPGLGILPLSQLRELLVKFRLLNSCAVLCVCVCMFVLCVSESSVKWDKMSQSGTYKCK